MFVGKEQEGSLGFRSVEVKEGGDSKIDMAVGVERLNLVLFTRAQGSRGYGFLNIRCSCVCLFVSLQCV